MRTLRGVSFRAVWMGVPALLTFLLMLNCTAQVTARPTVSPEAHKACLRQLFGDPVNGSKQEASMAVVLRVVDSCGIDKQLELIDDDHSIEITVTTSESTSVRRQLIELTGRYPDMAAEVRCGHVEMESRQLSAPEDRVKAAELLRRLEDPGFFPVSQTDLFLHGRVYSLWINRVPNRSYHEFYGPATGHTDEPLERWAFDALYAFQLLCESETPG